ncbi:MAG: hypothetical protein NTW67_00920 [Candidatus Woesearchaeota archaeon]|nr:hypothetical protein [Candidatus Woesearchaeota archaeon]
MKKIALFVLLIALFALGASAMQISSPSLGGENQDRIKVQSTFTITNNNSAAISNIAISAGGGAENSKYAFGFTNVPASLAAGASATVTINGTIPLDHPGVDSTDLKIKALKVGIITVSGTIGSASDSASADVMMQAVNQLAIKKARIDCNDKSQSLTDGDRVKNLKPGYECTLEVQVENNFDDSDSNSLKIGDISFSSVDVNIDSSSNDLDIDDPDSIDDLAGNDDDAVTSTIQIDEEASDGTISLDIRVSGRDDNGALHGEAITAKMEVKRLTHDVQLRRIELSPSVVENCDDSNVKVSVNILNQGKRDEDIAAVEISVPDLKFIKKIDNIQLDKDDSTSVSFDVPVPKSAKVGVMRVDVKTYFDSLAISNSGSADLTILGCEETEVVEPAKENKTTVVVPQQTITPSQGQSQAAPKKTTTTSFTSSKAYVALLAVLSVLIAVAIVALVVMIVRKKPQ